MVVVEVVVVVVVVMVVVMVKRQGEGGVMQGPVGVEVKFQQEVVVTR
ncbi:hypothetical protein QQP08_006923 [Theobroma cacao]|nr:hypothetical protein QQP08_006923 [Theobroma cacao]